ncbi:LamG domain-containing protein [Streptomyces wuyuanensis]|uniref:hypothetical protein n=1 Tax=Streptomyces wuyuanensis TaxID=1196353 RepID=UPI000B8732DC|nr:hypothetical protein [Streptomyces wuyuanensis]
MGRSPEQVWPPEERHLRRFKERHQPGVFDATEKAESGGYGVARLYLEGADQQVSPTFTTAQQGRGDLAAGRGRAADTTGHYLPGALTQMRIWAGAMTANQIMDRVVGDPVAE